jgi:hypothetical protein
MYSHLSYQQTSLRAHHSPVWDIRTNGLDDTKQLSMNELGIWNMMVGLDLFVMVRGLDRTCPRRRLSACTAS